MASTTVSPLELDQGAAAERTLEKISDYNEAKKQVLFSIPMIITNVCYYSITLISTMFSGHLGDLELASSTLANSWATVTGFALVTGLTGALETLCGKAYGAKRYRMTGIYLQALIITTVAFSILVSFIWFYTEPILLLLHQEPKVAKMAGTYMRYLTPGLFAYAFLQCILRFLQIQSVVLPLVFCSFVPLCVHIGITYAMVYCTSLGVKGAALSATISLWLSLIMLVLYVQFFNKSKNTWEGFSTECFNQVFPSLKLAIPSAIMVCLEYWAFDILVILAGLMPNSENSTSVISICVNTEAMAYMITYGFSAAVSTRVANELGAGNSRRAKHSVSVTLKLSIFLGLALVISLIFGHNLWASLFTKSHVIKKEFASLTPFLVISILFDSGQGVLSGVSRGCGWQHLAAWTNLISFYVVGMTIAAILAFKVHLYAKGLWIGLICGLACQTCTLQLITIRINWSKLEVPVNDNEEENVQV